MPLTPDELTSAYLPQSRGRAVSRLLPPWPVRLAAIAALCAAGGMASAVEPELEPIVLPPPGATFDVAFGAALTTDYVSRGITNSDSDPAVQGYIEPSLEWAYVNVWASNVDFGEGFRGTEIDVGAGVRPDVGPLSLDFGYVHYFYTPKDTSPDYGEIFAKANYTVNDKITLGLRLFFAPDFNQTGETATFLAGGAKVALPYDISAYAGIGYQFFEDPDNFEQLAWTAGASYSWKALTFDVRYWDTDLSRDECEVRSGFKDGCDARVVGTVSFDTSWTELRDWAR